MASFSEILEVGLAMVVFLVTRPLNLIARTTSQALACHGRCLPLKKLTSTQHLCCAPTLRSALRPMQAPVRQRLSKRPPLAAKSKSQTVPHNHCFRKSQLHKPKPHLNSSLLQSNKYPAYHLTTSRKLLSHAPIAPSLSGDPTSSNAIGKMCTHR